jgi:hypothetical protein
MLNAETQRAQRKWEPNQENPLAKPASRAPAPLSIILTLVDCDSNTSLLPTEHSVDEMIDQRAEEQQPQNKDLGGLNYCHTILEEGAVTPSAALL